MIVIYIFVSKLIGHMTHVSNYSDVIWYHYKNYIHEHEGKNDYKASTNVGICRQEKKITFQE